MRHAGLRGLAAMPCRARSTDSRHDRPNPLWKTDFIYLEVVGWGWRHLGGILDDVNRHVVAWTLCTTLRAEDVTDTLELALAASGCDRSTVLHRPRGRLATTPPPASPAIWLTV